MSVAQLSPRESDSDQESQITVPVRRSFVFSRGSVLTEFCPFAEFTDGRAAGQF
jgi:hypothetical protein